MEPVVNALGDAPRTLAFIENNASAAMAIPGMRLMRDTLLYMKRRGLFGDTEACLFLGPKYVCAMVVLRKMQRAFRKRVIIPRVRATIKTFCESQSLPSHIHDEILRQYFKL